jgi:CheY-like chemotaxis protein/anti-sigma regulatory factor (Ser/Thr protein kinase)
MANVGFVWERLGKLASEEGVPPELAAQIDELRSALTEAQEGTVRIRRIVRDLRIFVRPDEGRPEVFDVRSLLESSISMAWSELRQRARLVRRMEAVPRVRATASRLGHVFLQLLLNAAQAIPEGDPAGNEVRVSTETDTAGKVVVSVSDTGIGIPNEDLGRIFDPFFTTKPVGAGTGLGLFVCHSMVRSFGGDLTVESEAGRGATFRVVLPPAEPRPVDGARRLRVLLVAEEARVGDPLERALAVEHDVTLARGGEEGIEILGRSAGFDVVMCELLMPKTSGVDLFRWLQREDPALARRTVFVVAASVTARARAFLAEVPNRRIAKPFDLDELRSVVGEVAETAS